ncbi:hypothetical protein EfmJHP36_12380 [Enterococcus faecium]|nr:hypothetical protein EfmJHP36_12380 [Enterococcus faecium]
MILFLTAVFNQLMENQRTEYIQADDYERSESRQSQRNGYYERTNSDPMSSIQITNPRDDPIVPISTPLIPISKTINKSKDNNKFTPASIIGFLINCHSPIIFMWKICIEIFCF